MDEINIHNEYNGELLRVWVALPGRPSISIANASENLTRDEILARAERYWSECDEGERKAAILREKYDLQVFVGNLPSREIEWTGKPGRYTFVLKERRRHGKYQVLEAL